VGGGLGVGECVEWFDKAILMTASRLQEDEVWMRSPGMIFVFLVVVLRCLATMI